MTTPLKKIVIVGGGAGGLELATQLGKKLGRGKKAKITLVDIRYLMPELLGRFVEFHGQDILFLYSTLVINNSTIIK